MRRRQGRMITAQDSQTGSKTELMPVASSLSIVVVPIAYGDHLEACLGALRRQIDAVVAEIELIVPCDSNAAELSGLMERYPEVEFKRVEGYRTYAELRALGVSHARGQIIAITEDHCRPAGDWCTQILEAHYHTHAAIGGAVEKRPPDTGVNWAIYFADYLRYMTPEPEGQRHSLTDLNVSYKRSALQAIRTEWLEEFHEPLVHGALKSRDETLWFSPAMIVYLDRKLSLADAIGDRYRFGRLFGSTRARQFSSSQRAIFALISPAIPLLQLARVVSQIIRKGRHTAEFVRAFPWLIVLAAVWSWGEFVGYVTGNSHRYLGPVNQASQSPG